MNKNVYILFFVTVEQRIRTLTQRNARHEKYDVSMLLDEQVTNDHYCTQINEYLRT